MRITKAIRNFENEFDQMTEKLLWKHPLLGALVVFCGLPILILACVCLITAAIAVPTAFLFGWL